MLIRLVLLTQVVFSERDHPTARQTEFGERHGAAIRQNNATASTAEFWEWGGVRRLR
jgi:hypothetical protein